MSIRHDDGSLHPTLQFSDVTWPRISLEFGHETGLNVMYRLMGLGLMISACACSGGGGASPPTTTSEEMTTRLKVNLNSINTGGKQKAVGTLSDVSKVMGKVSSSTEFTLNDINFTHFGNGLWEASVNSLPINENLIMAVSAMNTGGTPIG
jgi:hypothetical protein